MWRIDNKANSVQLHCNCQLELSLAKDSSTGLEMSAKVFKKHVILVHGNVVARDMSPYMDGYNLNT